MSRFYYIASNKKLDELTNPYTELMSVNTAFDKGIDLDMDFIKENINPKDEKALLFSEDESKLGIPIVYNIRKRDYKLIVKTKKKYTYAIELDLDISNIEILLEYLNKQFKFTDSIDFYSIYLDENNESNETEISISSLTLDLLKSFLEKDVPINLLRIQN